MTSASSTIGLTIQEVSRRSGLSEPTLRYYEKIGLLGPIARDESSGHRRYSAAGLQTAQTLACLRVAGTSVEEMRRYLRLLELGAAAEQRDLFSAQADRLSAHIDRLQWSLTYLQQKAKIWDARERGDEAADQRAIEAATHAAEQF